MHSRQCSTETLHGYIVNPTSETSFSSTLATSLDKVFPLLLLLLVNVASNSFSRR